jgi:phospholipid/cholesterol/gamma-HCH transport system ATP-binding protein
MLSVKNLCVELNGRFVLKNLNLDLDYNESLVILGCSGVGKSVLLKSIFGLLPISSGNIIIKGVDVTTASDESRTEAIRSIGMLFQGAALFDSLPIWENVAFGLIYGKQIDVKVAKTIALEKMKLVDLSEKIADLFPSFLSGGMKKRVGLARALALNPQLMFFDEPTTGLDPITGDIVNKLISKLVKDSKIAAITITHDLTCARVVADTIAFLHDGEIVWKGKSHEIYTTKHPKVREFVDIGSNPECRPI